MRSRAARWLRSALLDTNDRESAYQKPTARAAPPVEQFVEAPPAEAERDEPGVVEQVLGNTAMKSFQ